MSTPQHSPQEVTVSTHVRLARIAGIEVGLHYSWFLLAGALCWWLAAHFHGLYPGWTPAAVWAAATMTGMLFFGAVLLHEVAHALVARARRLPVRSITLYAFGGVTHLERDGADPDTELWMGVVGPLCNALVGIAGLGAAQVAGWTPGTPSSSPMVALLVWSGYINLSLALFNMIPGFPLDGGRVLRAVLWHRIKDPNRATRVAAQIAQAVALAMVALGTWHLAGGHGLHWIWVAGLGWFLLDTAWDSYAQADLVAGLRGLRVADVMLRDLPIIDGGADVQQFARRYLFRTGGRYFVVHEDGQPAGLLMPDDIARVDRARWSQTRVDDVMRPLDQLYTVAPDMPLDKAVTAMRRRHMLQLPVVAGGRLYGILSRGQLWCLAPEPAELSL
jgi:Zn-dependent protease/CBS domain-containing protein